jgi:hypothetical protein
MGDFAYVITVLDIQLSVFRNSSQIVRPAVPYPRLQRQSRWSDNTPTRQQYHRLLINTDHAHMGQPTAHKMHVDDAASEIVDGNDVGFRTVESVGSLMTRRTSSPAIGPASL